MKAVDHAPNGVLITDSNGVIMYANPGFTNITGYSLAETKGKTPRILSSGQHSQAFYKKFWATIKDGKSWQGVVRNKRKDGTYFWCRETVSPVVRRDGSISNFIAMQQDVTIEVEAEQRLKASEERFRGFADAASDWYWEMDADLKFSYVSEAACESAGMTRDEMLGMQRSELVTLKDEEEDRKKHLQVLLDRKPFKDFTYTFVRKDGEHRHWKISGAPYYSEDGEFLGYRGVGRDVTEPTVLEAQLKQSQKMEVVGQLTGGIAHDFNNLLAVVLGNAELAEEMLEEEIDAERLKAHLKTIIHAASVGSSITSQLLMYSRKQMLKPKRLNLQHEISEFLEILKSSVGQMITVHLTSDDGLWETFLDRDQFVNTLLNLAVNARDAMQRSGDLFIQLKNVVVAKDEPGKVLSSGEYVCLKIRDTGAGMDDATLQHVFEPFYSTKEAGNGTGLGLSMVYGFVKKSGGTILIESSLGQGSTVTLYFPKYTEDPDN
nr:PAS domain S-box protein [Sneathiella limimaris]